tara:strand:- start:367 stop:648 length:282 start_codon:yes stop_codon:yes gene_type:complete
MTGIKSKSEVFKKFVEDVDTILNRTEITDAAGNPTDYHGDHFQAQMKRLTQTHMVFEDMPIYPINEVMATNLLWDEIEAKQNEQDAQDAIRNN